MLLLTRKINESIIINNNIVVTIVDVKGKQICIGIDAPKDIEVHREEIWDRIQQQKSFAQAVDDDIDAEYGVLKGNA